MAPVNPPAWLQAGSYPARLDRQTLAALLTPDDNVGALASRSGVKPSTGRTRLQVTPRPTPDMWVRVTPGTCYVRGTSPDSGTYICHNDADYDLPVEASHVSLPRRDLVYAQVLDAADDTGTSNEFIIDVATGTPASSPSRPVLPSQAVPLAQIDVAAGATAITGADITDLRSYVVPLGGTLPVTGAADLPAAPYPGMKVFRMDQQVEQIWDGAAWQTLMDSSFRAPIGTIGFDQWDVEPNYTVTSTGGVAIRYDGTNPARVAFNIPPGLTANRALRFTITGNFLVDSGARMWIAPYIDSSLLLMERRLGIPFDGMGHQLSNVTITRATYLDPGPHYVEARCRMEAGGTSGMCSSMEMQVEVI